MQIVPRPGAGAYVDAVALGQLSDVLAALSCLASASLSATSVRYSLTMAVRVVSFWKAMTRTFLTTDSSKLKVMFTFLPSWPSPPHNKCHT